MSKTHDYPKGSRRREPLYDMDIPTPSHAERAKTLVAGEGTGTLCTIAREPAGHPYGSFVTYGIYDSKPVFLVSQLAEHTQNMLQDGKASLLVAEPGTGDPLARARATLVGVGRQLEGDEAAGARLTYLEAHPSASYYVDYRDFSFWTLDVSTVRYIGGYGRMSWVEHNAWTSSTADPIAPLASRMITHMNADHQEAMRLMCRAYSRAEEFSDVLMTGIDRYGFEMSLKTGEGNRPVRVAFGETVLTAEEAREQLVSLTKAARSQLESAQR